MKVFVSPQGRVFHASAACPRLLLSSAVLEADLLPSMPVINSVGRLTTRCTVCWVDEPAPPPASVLSIEEACKVLGVSLWQGKRLANAGTFPGAFKFGPNGWWRVSKVALEQFLAAPISG